MEGADSASETELTESKRREIIAFCKAQQDSDWAKVARCLGVTPKQVSAVYFDYLMSGK